MVIVFVDPCEGITCTMTGETCTNGTCKCGTAASCEGNKMVDTCDADWNVCRCSAQDACRKNWIMGAKCSAGVCTGISSISFSIIM